MNEIEKQALIKLENALKRRGFAISKKQPYQKGFTISFYHPRSFEKLKKEKGEGYALHFGLSGCVVEERNGKPYFKCNIVNPVRKMVEFWFDYDDESFRPHFLPEDDVVGIEVKTHNIERIEEILDSFLNAI